MERWAEVSYYYNCLVSYTLEPPCSVLVLFLCLVKSISEKPDRQQVRCSVMCEGVNTHLSFLGGVHRAPPAVGLCLSPPPAAAGRSSPRQTGASAAAESGRSENRRRCQSLSHCLSLSHRCVWTGLLILPVSSSPPALPPSPRAAAAASCESSRLRPSERLPASSARSSEE